MISLPAPTTRRRTNRRTASPLSPRQLAAVAAHLGLSDRQTRVLDLILRGYTNKEIAGEINLREPTVKTYLDRISSRTGTRGRLDLVVFVLSLAHQIDRDESRSRQSAEDIPAPSERAKPAKSVKKPARKSPANRPTA